MRQGGGQVELVSQHGAWPQQPSAPQWVALAAQGVRNLTQPFCCLQQQMALQMERAFWVWGSLAQCQRLQASLVKLLLEIASACQGEVPFHPRLWEKGGASHHWQASLRVRASQTQVLHQQACLRLLPWCQLKPSELAMSLASQEEECQLSPEVSKRLLDLQGWQNQVLASRLPL